MGLAKHDEDVVRKGWNIVEKNQDKISTLVMDMLTFSKEREPDPVPGDMNQVVGEVVELMQSRADELDVALDWQPGEDIPDACFRSRGHASRRAEHRHQRHRRLRGDAPTAQVDDRHASTAPTKRLARIIVEDNGAGIAAEDLDKIFTLFVSDKGSRGTGLGLPVSQKILSEHGGQIHVESTPGAGSRFTLELPAITAPAEAPAVKETADGVERPV